MGYEIHITRASDWGESESSPITLDEWLAYVASDPEMQRTDIATDGPEGHQYRNEGLAAWTAYSGHRVDGDIAWFDPFNGRIDVVRPDEEIITKMKAVARALNARVVDDFEEWFD